MSHSDDSTLPTLNPAVATAAPVPVVAASAAAPVAAPVAAVVATPTAAPRMSSDTSDMLGSYGHLPMLSRENYLQWKIAVKAFLTPYDHVRVIKSVRDASGALVDPTRPTDAAELKTWETSESIAMGVVFGTSYDLHPDLVAKHEGGRVLDLWKAIEARHANTDSIYRHHAWMLLFGHRMMPDDDHVEYWRRGADVKSRIDQTTPGNLTVCQVLEEIYLFAQISGLRPDDPLRHYYISQPIPSAAELYAAFLRVSMHKKTAAQIKTANAAYSHNCHRCLQPGHFAKACPHAEALDKLVTQRLNLNKRWKPTPM